VDKLLSPLREFVKKGDLILLSLCLLACGYGLVLIYSATRFLDSNKNLILQASAIILGVCIYIAMTLVDFQLFTEKCWKWILCFDIGLILLLLTPLGLNVNGNLNWLNIPHFPANLQPNEIVKVPFILLTSLFIVRLQNQGYSINSLHSISLVTAHALLMIGLIVVICGDMGTCMVYACILIIMLWISGFRLRWFILGGLAALFAIVVLVIFILPETNYWNDYRIMRFRVVFDHSLDPAGIGWHQERSILAVGSGQLTGQGYLQGTQTQSPYSSSLPFRHTDFIFSVCGEEFGLVGCALLLLILFSIVLRCVWIAHTANSSFSAYTVIGIAGMLAVQIIFNVGMCVYILPVMGLTLPFISSGGSSIVTTFAAMGVVSSVKAHPMPSWLRDRSQI